MSTNTNRYLEELEKYKDVELKLGLCHLKDKPSIKIEILEIIPEKDLVIMKTISSGKVNKKTMHWSRKNLEFEGENNG